MQNKNIKMSMMNLKAKSYKLSAIGGMTLIEMLIYIALVSTVIGGILYSSSALLNSTRVINNKVLAEEEANFTLKKIEWALTGFQTINSPSSGASAASISITKFNYANNPIVFDLDSGNIRIQKAGGTVTVLNSSQVMVSNLSFNHIAATGNSPDGIKATMDIKATADINARNYQLVIYKKK